MESTARQRQRAVSTEREKLRKKGVKVLEFTAYCVMEKILDLTGKIDLSKTK